MSRDGRRTTSSALLCVLHPARGSASLCSALTTAVSWSGKIGGSFSPQLRIRPVPTPCRHSLRAGDSRPSQRWRLVRPNKGTTRGGERLASTTMGCSATRVEVPDQTTRGDVTITAERDDEVDTLEQCGNGDEEAATYPQGQSPQAPPPPDNVHPDHPSVEEAEWAAREEQLDSYVQRLVDAAGLRTNWPARGGWGGRSALPSVLWATFRRRRRRPRG